MGKCAMLGLSQQSGVMHMRSCDVHGCAHAYGLRQAQKPVQACMQMYTGSKGGPQLSQAASIKPPLTSAQY